MTTSAGSLKRPLTLRAWLFAAPLGLWLFALVVVPNLLLVVYAFCDRDDLGQVVFRFSTESVLRMFQPSYLLILWRSVKLAGLTTLVCLLVGYPVAYFIGRSGPAWKNKLLLLVMVPFWTSFLIRTYAWMILLRSEGIVNAVLQWAHVVSVPLDLMYTEGAVVLGLVYAYLPFSILPIYTSAERLDPSLIEAARDLGASPLRAFWHVAFPLTWPGVVAGGLFVFIPSIGMFAITDLMGGGRVPLVGNVIQSQFGQARNWPFGAALGVLLLVGFGAAFWLTTKLGGGAAVQDGAPAHDGAPDPLRGPPPHTPGREVA